MGMIGGGKDAFIGAIHRIAANMDGQIEFVCGALSINPEIAKDSGKSLFLADDRIYLEYTDMIKKESSMSPDKRIDFITIVTPNFAHFAPAMAALDNGREKFDPIARKIEGAPEQQVATATKRVELREILGTKIMREITLK